LRSGRNHGIGDIRDLYALVDWAEVNRLSFIQLLPLSPLNPEFSYPYSAYSAFGLDLSVIAIDDVPEIRDAGAAQNILSEASASGDLEALRTADRLDYARVDALKRRALWEAYRHFERTAAASRKDFSAYRAEERSWLNDFALFSALKERFGWKAPWREWPGPLREHDTAALDAFAAENASLIGFYAYTQWVARRQWEALQSYAHGRGVSFMGDLPIYVGGDSADVWARRDLFDLEAQGGAPPDYFNWLGQNWSSPLYDWERMREDGYVWWKDRVRHHAQCFDGLRFDHFRGVSEYWCIPMRPAILDEIDRETEIPRMAKEYQKVCWFWPIKFKFQFRERMSEAEWSQLSESRRLGVLQQIGANWVKGPGAPFMQAMLDASQREQGTLWVVEDLGADMDKVYELRDALKLPGMRVVQFFGYDDQGRANPHVDPAHYPRNSMAMSDTHDLPPLRAWVEGLTEDQRRPITWVYQMAPGSEKVPVAEFERAILEKLFGCPSRWVVVSLQTILGLGAGDRINTPGTVGPENWTWRMPGKLEGLPALPWLQELLETTGRH
jgi:4-alpha-glucanotransferase